MTKLSKETNLYTRFLKGQYRLVNIYYSGIVSSMKAQILLGLWWPFGLRASWSVEVLPKNKLHTRNSRCPEGLSQPSIK